MDNLKQKTFHSVLWSVARVAWSSMASMVVFVVLTRLLDPHAFGLFALSTLFIETARVIASAGLADAVTREPDLDEKTADTAFWANIVFATAIAVLTSFAAWPYANFMREPSLTLLVPALALVMPITALGAIHTARLMRDFGHKAIALRTMLTTLIGGAAGVIAAFKGAGVWSLVIQNMVGEILGLGLVLYFYRWMPAFRFSGASLRRLLGFSIGMMITQMFWIMLARIPELFIGRFLGTAAVGQYRVAWRLIDLVGQAVLAPISSVALVTLSHVQRDDERFAGIYRRIVATAGLIAYPVLFGFAAIGDQLIPLVFGQQWHESTDLIKIFALMAVPFTINYFAGPALAAKGNSGAILSVAAAQFFITLVVCFLAAPYGLFVIAVAYVARAYLTLFYQMHMLEAKSGISATRTLVDVCPSFVIAGAMAVAVYFAGQYLAFFLGTGWVSILALGCLGAFLYAAGVILFARSQLLEALEATGLAKSRYLAPLGLLLKK